MLVVHVLQFLSADVEETAELPQLRRFAWILLLPCPSLCNDSCLGSDVRKLRMSRMGYANSEGASNSAHRLLFWTFQLCNTDGYDASSILGYGGDECFFRGCSAFFALLRVVPELSASFRSSCTISC